MKEHIRVYADSACNILYASYFIHGLERYFNIKVEFSNNRFKSLPSKGLILFVELIVDDQITKIAFDHSNFNDVDYQALEWSDVYGKVNLNEQDLDLPKVYPMGPISAINIYSMGESLRLALLNMMKSWHRINNPKYFLSLYKAQLYRPKLDSYKGGVKKKGYMFFASSLWKKESTYNDTRNNFISSVKQIKSIVFDGGFAPRTKNDIQGYELNTMSERLPNEAFLEKCKKSEFVFHTPSVGGCNGWRLCEYLAMGKVIISTPLVNVLPGNFKSGIHFLETKGSHEDNLEVIRLIQEESELVSEIEKNIEEYFNEHISPEKMVSNLINSVL